MGEPRTKWAKKEKKVASATLSRKARIWLLVNSDRGVIHERNIDTGWGMNHALNLIHVVLSLYAWGTYTTILKGYDIEVVREFYAEYFQLKINKLEDLLLDHPITIRGVEFMFGPGVINDYFNIPEEHIHSLYKEPAYHELKYQDILLNIPRVLLGEGFREDTVGISIPRATLNEKARFWMHFVETNFKANSTPGRA